MILGFGIDLLEQNRIESVYNRFGIAFLKKVLSTKEIELFSSLENNNRKIAFISKCFSVKESFLKAVGIGMGRGILMTDITLTKNNFGKPEILLNENSKNFISKYYNIDYKKINFIVSVTDERSLINTAVIIDYDKF